MTKEYSEYEWYFETVSNLEVIKPEKKRITLRHYPD